MTDLEWATLSDLEIGEAYTLGIESPLTFLLVGVHSGRGGRAEYDVTTLVGPGGRSSTRTYWRPNQEVLIVPAEAVGHRLSAAATAFAERERRGLDRIALGSDVWPSSLAPEDIEDVTDEDNDPVVVFADERVV